MGQVICKHCKDNMYWTTSERKESVCGSCIAELEAKAAQRDAIEEEFIRYYDGDTGHGFLIDVVTKILRNEKVS